MSGANVLDFGSSHDLENLDFPNLKKNLELRMASFRTLPDLEQLIKLMKPLLKNERFTEDEQNDLRRLRQRAYDRRRKSKFEKINSAPSKTKIQKVQTTKSVERSEPSLFATIHSSKISTDRLPAEIFGQGLEKAISNIDGESLLKLAPKLLAWFASSAVVSFFLWQQSLSLYETSGFLNARQAATGGVLMIVGFAAYHSISRSWLALFFCLYAISYEGYLMVFGTIHDDKQTAVVAVQSNPELIFLQEKADKERSRYHDLKNRYDDPESKVFHNEWFLKNHINPSWEASTKAHEQYAAKKSNLDESSHNKSITLLKILYRLGLVFLCMLLVHQLFAAFINNTATNEKCSQRCTPTN